MNWIKDSIDKMNEKLNHKKKEPNELDVEFWKEEHAKGRAVITSYTDRTAWNEVRGGGSFNHEPGKVKFKYYEKGDL